MSDLDLLSTLRALPGAYIDACWRDVAPQHRSRVGVAASVVLLGMFVVFLGIVLSHPFYLGNDSAQSYAHVWFIAQALFTGHGIPLRMTDLEAGRAFTFPYAVIPWLPSALLRPLLGDWVVTASMVGGVAFLAAGIWRWLPRTTSPLLTAMMLLSPLLWSGIAQFQLPTYWAFAFACWSAAALDRGQSRRGVAFAVGAIVAHPLMGIAALGCTGLVAIEAERRLPVRRVVLLAAATVLASPAIWAFVRTPLLEHVGATSLLQPIDLTMRRLVILAWPWFLQRTLPLALRLHVPLLLIGVVLVGNNAITRVPSNLWERSAPRFADYIADGRVLPEATYRILVTNSHEDGMVQIMEAGGHLAQEFFDESIRRDSFASTDAYRCFLAQKRADRVLVSADWIARSYTNELQLLETLIQEHRATLAYRGAAGTLDYAISPAPDLACDTRGAS